jgi:hypothetical protein
MIDVRVVIRTECSFLKEDTEDKGHIQIRYNNFGKRGRDCMSQFWKEREGLHVSISTFCEVN